MVRDLELAALLDQIGTVEQRVRCPNDHWVAWNDVPEATLCDRSATRFGTSRARHRVRVASQWCQVLTARRLW